MQKKLSRAQLCGLIGITSLNLANRMRTGQLSLAFGLEGPAALGEYHPLDVFTHKLADALVERGFARETATDILREHNETWLLALTRAEWGPSSVTVILPPCPDVIGERIIYFAVAREKDAKSGEETFYAAQGFPEEALAALGEKPAADMVFVRVLDVLMDTIDAFQENGLLEWLVGPTGNFFTRPRGHPEFPEWRAEIERLRQASVDRRKMSVRLRYERSRAVREAMAKMRRENV